MLKFTSQQIHFYETEGFAQIGAYKTEFQTYYFILNLFNDEVLLCANVNSFKRTMWLLLFKRSGPVLFALAKFPNLQRGTYPCLREYRVRPNKMDRQKLWRGLLYSQLVWDRILMQVYSE